MESMNPAKTNADGFVSWREFLGSAYSGALVLVCLAVWLHAADSLIVATMLPTVVQDIGGTALIPWTISLYEIGSIVAGAASALLTMRYGLRRPMSLAATLFGVGCMISALSPSMPVLLAGRVLQGLGGGGLVAMGFVAAGVIFPRRYMARALATISALWGLSAFAGPLVGGLFVEYATWRWGFGFFGVQAFVLATWIAARNGIDGAQTEEDPAPFPLRRLGLLCAGIVLIALAGVEVSPLRTGGFLLLGLLLLWGFLRLDGDAGETRLLPRRPLALRQPEGAGLLMILCFSIATIAIGAYGPLLMTVIHETSALTAGYVIACSSIGWTLAAVAVSGAPERFDRYVIAVGMTVIALSILGFFYAVPNGPVWLIAVIAGFEGAGFGLSWTFILRQLTAHAAEEEKQRISGAMPTIQRLGYAVGAGYVGIVANATGLLEMEGATDAAEVARWLFGGSLPFAALGLVAMIALIKPRPDRP